MGIKNFFIALFILSFITIPLILINNLNNKEQHILRQEKTILTSSGERKFLIYNPDKAATLPLFIILHGGSENMFLAEERSGFSYLAEKNRFIAVYPQGSSDDNSDYNWNIGGCCGFAGEKNIDDVEFLNLLIGKIIAEYPVDKNRIYLVGFSSGAAMAYRYVCSHSEKIAGIGSISGAADKWGNCKIDSENSIIEFRDKQVVSSLAFPDSFYPPVEWGQCKGPTIVSEIDKLKEIYYVETQNCEPGIQQVYYQLNQGDHSWKHTVADENGNERESSFLIWDFLKDKVKK